MASHEPRTQACAECDGTGIHWPAHAGGHPPPPGWSWVRRCESCRQYQNDAAAAAALVNNGVGRKARWFEQTTGRRHRWWLNPGEPASVAIDITPDTRRETTVSADTVAGMYEQLGQQGCDEAVRGLRRALGREPAAVTWSQMAAAVEDAAGVLAFLAGDFQAAAGARGELAAQANTLVALAGRLEEAADLADL